MSSNQHNGPSTSTASSVIHSCEICGQSGLSDEKMLEHTQKCHVEGNAACPFCGLSGTSSAELLLHVNQAHLDYLTPENELMSFIDDSKTPSADGDSDSMSCGLSPSITEIPGIIHNHTNGVDSSKTNGDVSKTNGEVEKNLKQASSSKSTGASTKLTNGLTNGTKSHEQVRKGRNFIKNVGSFNFQLRKKYFRVNT